MFWAKRGHTFALQYGCQGDTRGSLHLRERRSFELWSSIWTPKTWPFYSLCFPCFSPVLISFCSASNSLHPSELREGWCVFTFWTQYNTVKYIYLPQRFFLNLFWYHSCFCHIFNVHVTIENAPSPCQNAWLSNRWCMFASLRWGGRDDICIYFRVYLHGQLFNAWASHPLSQLPIPTPYPVSVPACFLFFSVTNNKANPWDMKIIKKEVLFVK